MITKPKSIHSLVYMLVSMGIILGCSQLRFLRTTPVNASSHKFYGIRMPSLASLDQFTIDGYQNAKIQYTYNAKTMDDKIYALASLLWLDEELDSVSIRIFNQSSTAFSLHFLLDQYSIVDVEGETRYLEIEELSAYPNGILAPGKHVKVHLTTESVRYIDKEQIQALVCNLRSEHVLIIMKILPNPIKEEIQHYR